MGRTFRPTAAKHGILLLTQHSASRSAVQKQTIEVATRLHLFTFEKSRIGFCSRQSLHSLHLVLQCWMHQGSVTAKDNSPIPPCAVCTTELRRPPEVPCVNTNLPFVPIAPPGPADSTVPPPLPSTVFVHSARLLPAP